MLLGGSYFFVCGIFFVLGMGEREEESEVGQGRGALSLLKIEGGGFLGGDV